MRSIFFIFLLFVSSFLNPEGFVSGTLVLTSNGYTKIESLVPGDKVLCSDLKETITVGVVKEILRYQESQAVEIQTKYEKIKAESAQRFYDATEFCWKKAQNIKAGAILLGLDKDYEVELALASNGLQEYFSITVEPYSNFFVSKQNILVHNAAVLLRAFSDPRVGEAVAVAGAAVGEYFFGKDDRSEKKQKNKTGGQRRVEGRSEYKKSGGEPPREPDEDNEVKKGHIKFVNKEKILEDRNRIRDHVIRPEKHKLRGTKLEKEPEKMVEKVIDKTIELDRKGELIICEDGTFRTDLNDVFGYNLRHRGKILETGELKVGTIYRK